jgi:hypothetical protein
MINFNIIYIDNIYYIMVNNLILSSPNNPGPASFPTRQNINNGNISNVRMAMPAQFYPDFAASVRPGEPKRLRQP